MEKVHRENGPVVICNSGDEAWCYNGKRHRDDRTNGNIDVKYNHELKPFSHDQFKMI